MTDTMPAVVLLGERRAELRTTPRPSPQEGQVRLRVTSSGVCGSDLHRYRSSSAERAPHADRIVGHEAVGTVDAVGPGVDAGLVGRRCAVHHVWSCRTVAAPCRRSCGDSPKDCAELRIMGRDVDGGDAGWQVTPADRLLPVPDDFSDADAVVAVCNLGTAWAGLRSRVTAGTAVTVWGLGPVGRCAAVVAQALGAAVLGVDPDPRRRAAAAAAGLPAVEAAEIAAGSRGADVAVDTSGQPAAHDAAVRSLRRGGRLVLLGMGAERLDLPLRTVLLREVRIEGVFVYDQTDWPALLEFVREHRLQPGDLVSARVRWRAAPQAFRLADAGEPGKVLLDWTAP